MNIEQAQHKLLAVTVSVLIGTATLGSAPEAMAGTISSLTQASHVTDSVQDLGGGNYGYSYTVFNDGTSGFQGYGEEVPVIIDWELPYFTDMQITNIVSPDGWDYNIETVGSVNAATGWDGVVSWFDPGDPWYDDFGPDSPFGVNNLTEVLHWYCIDPSVVIGDGVQGTCGSEQEGLPIFPVDSGNSQTSLGGFGFDAPFTEAAAPYQASWLFLPVQSGDPAFPTIGLAGSPTVRGETANVPEPGTLALLSMGLLGLFGAKRKRAKA